MANLPATAAQPSSTSFSSHHISATNYPISTSLFSTSIPKDMDKEVLWEMFRQREQQLLDRVRSAEASATKAQDKVAYWQDAYLHRKCSCWLFRTEISSLPNEILTITFHKLNSVDHVNMRRVCSRWKGILADASFTQHLFINVDGYGWGTPPAGQRSGSEKMKDDCASLVGDDVRHITFYSEKRVQPFTTDIPDVAVGMMQRCLKLEYVTLSRLYFMCLWWSCVGSQDLPDTLKAVSIVSCTVFLALSGEPESEDEETTFISQFSLDMTGDRGKNFSEAIQLFFPKIYPKNATP